MSVLLASLNISFLFNFLDITSLLFIFLSKALFLMDMAMLLSSVLEHSSTAYGNLFNN